MELAGCSRGEDGGGARVVGMVRRVLPRVAGAGIRFRIMFCRLDRMCRLFRVQSCLFTHISQRFYLRNIPTRWLSPPGVLRLYCRQLRCSSRRLLDTSLFRCQNSDPTYMVLIRCFSPHASCSRATLRAPPPAAAYRLPARNSPRTVLCPACDLDRTRGPSTSR